MLFTEKMITLDEAAKLMPVPGARSKSSLYRWWRYGYNGVKLECRRVGRALFTSREAVERFAAALAGAGAVAEIDGEATEGVTRVRKSKARQLSVPERIVPRPAFDARSILLNAGIFQAATV